MAVLVLAKATGLDEVVGFVFKLGQPAIIEPFIVVVNKKRNDVVVKALFKGNKAAYAAISVLKGMNGFKPIVKLYDGLKSDVF